LGIPSQYAGDVWIGLLFLVASLVLLFLVKRDNLGAFLVSVYISYAVLSRSFIDSLIRESEIKLLVFLTLTGLIFFLFREMIFLEVERGKRAVIDWVRVLAFSLSLVGLMVSIVMDWISRDAAENIFSSLLINIFHAPGAQVIWTLLPLLLLLVYRRWK
jgi:hypothetical protein